MTKLATNITAFEEGFSATPYYCSEGYPTVGYGKKIGRKDEPLPCFILPEPVALKWLELDILDLEKALESDMEPIKNANRRAIIISMAYQLGVNGCRNFKKMWSAINEGDWSKAADEMLDSRWCDQTPLRCYYHAEVMKTGELPTTRYNF